jgi:hypothetical protein
MLKRTTIGRALWRALLLTLLLSFEPAVAQEIEVGNGVICDRGEQAEGYAALFKGDVDEALTQVNAETKSDTACGVISAAYLRGNNVSKVANEEGTFIVARILIVGIVTPHGIQSIPPFVQFTLFKIEERAA